MIAIADSVLRDGKKLALHQIAGQFRLHCTLQLAFTRLPTILPFLSILFSLKLDPAQMDKKEGVTTMTKEQKAALKAQRRAVFVSLSICMPRDHVHYVFFSIYFCS